MSTKFVNKSFLIRTASIFMIVMLLLAAMPATSASAATDGFFSPTKAKSNGPGWRNSIYTFTSNDYYATATAPNKRLKLTNFYITPIQGNATIDGIEVTVEGKTLGLGVEVQVDGGGGMKATKQVALSESEAVYTLGGSTDTWGKTWSPSAFTNANFSILLKTTGTNADKGKTVSIDHVKVKIYYTVGDTTLILSPVSGEYGQTATMTATLTATATISGLSGKTISFSLNGISVGTAVTNDSGVATKQVSLAGIAAGDYPYGARASFAGGGGYTSNYITADLRVHGTLTTITVNPITTTYGSSAPVIFHAVLTETNSGNPLSSRTVNFYLGDTFMGSAPTNTSGVAEISVAMLAGYEAGTFIEEVEASFAGSLNVESSTDTADLIVNSVELTVSGGLTPVNKVYDGTTAATLTIGSPTLVGVISPDVVSLVTTGAVGTFDDANVGDNKTVQISGLTLSGVDAGNYLLIQPTRYGNITQALADGICTVTGWSGAYDGSAHGASGTCIGLDGADLSADLDLGESFTNVPGGTATWSFSNPNYFDKDGTVTIDIVKADANCSSIIGWSGTYDGSAHSASGSCKGIGDVVLSGLDLGDSFTNVPGGDANWTFTDVTGNYNDIPDGSAIIAISAKDVDVTANDKTVFVGSSDPAFDFSVNGFISPDTFSTEPTCSVDGDHTAVDTYDIVCAGGDAGANYQIVYTDGTFTVTDKIILDVTSPSATITYGDPLPDLTLTASNYSGFEPDDDFSMIDTPPTCTAGTGLLTVASSPYTVTCSGGSDDKYAFNPINSGTLTITPKSLTIYANSAAKATGETITFDGTEFTAPGLVGSDTITSVILTSDGAAASAISGIYPITITPNSEIGSGLGNYDPINYEAGTLTVTSVDTITVLNSVGSKDGWILESGEKTNRGGTKNSSSKYLRIGDDASNKQYRSILSFDTSSLPDNAIITGVTLKFKYAGVSGTLPFKTHGRLLADIRNGAFSASAKLQLGDFRASGTNKVLSYTSKKVDRWYSKALSSTYFPKISRVSVTQFRLRFTKDDNNDLGADYLKIYSGNAGLASRPQLIITWHLP
jgi:hypothetical protein